eukprot:1730040-Pleurochrysis_carterae.AAC.7
MTGVGWSFIVEWMEKCVKTFEWSAQLATVSLPRRRACLDKTFTIASSGGVLAAVLTPGRVDGNSMSLRHRSGSMEVCIDATLRSCAGECVCARVQAVRLSLGGSTAACPPPSASSCRPATRARSPSP